jgi:hypothetical protein
VSDALEQRAKALEEEFFLKENQKKIAAMKVKLEAQQARDELQAASGMSDPAVLDRLVNLGIRADTMVALSLVPLIAVAWADGSIQDEEKESILAGAHGKGVEAGTPGYELLKGWLSQKPADGLLEAWESYIKALRSELNPEQSALLKTRIVGFAKLVAGSSGGILGIAKVSSAEAKVLARIEAAF